MKKKEHSEKINWLGFCTQRISEVPKIFATISSTFWLDLAAVPITAYMYQ